MIIVWRSIPGNIIWSPNWKTQRDPKFGATGKNQSSRRVIHVFRFFFRSHLKNWIFFSLPSGFVKGTFSQRINPINFMASSVELKLFRPFILHTKSSHSLRKYPHTTERGKNNIEQKKRFFLPRGRNKNGQKSFPSSHGQIEATPIAWRKHVGFTF